MTPSVIVEKRGVERGDWWDEGGAKNGKQGRTYISARDLVLPRIDSVVGAHGRVGVFSSTRHIEGLN